MPTISVKSAAAIARSQKVGADGQPIEPYSGPDEYEPLVKWLESVGIELVDSESGEPFKIAKAVVVKPEPGEKADEPETIDPDELKRLKRLAAEAMASKGAAKAGVTRVHAAAASPGRTPADYRRAAEHKAYNAKAARGETQFVDADAADVYGAWFRLGVLAKHVGGDYALKARDVEILAKANVTVDFGLGGALVPDFLDATLIDNRLKFGVASKLAGFQPMSSDKVGLVASDGELTVYFPGEANTITPSNPNYKRHALNARKAATLTEVSSEVLNDASVNIADDVARKINWAFARNMDDRFVNGDGTFTYAGDVGVRGALLALDSTIGNIAGLVVGTGNEWSELVLADFIATVGRLPDYENPAGDPKWLVSRAFHESVMKRVALGTPGTSSVEVVGGVRTANFLGYEVVTSNAMPRVQDNSQICALFGWFDMGARVGEVRNSMRIDLDTSIGFKEDTVWVRGLVRNAVTVYDVGNASATAALREPGPIVGLITAAS